MPVYVSVYVRACVYPIYPTLKKVLSQIERRPYQLCNHRGRKTITIALGTISSTWENLRCGPILLSPTRITYKDSCLSDNVVFCFKYFKLNLY